MPSADSISRRDPAPIRRPGKIAPYTGLGRFVGCHRPVVLPEHPIQTARLTLRPSSLDDFDDLYAYQSQADVARYLHWEARDHAQVRKALEDHCRETTLDAEGQWLTFAVVWREVGKVDGEVGLCRASRTPPLAQEPQRLERTPGPDAGPAAPRPRPGPRRQRRAAPRCGEKRGSAARLGPAPPAAASRHRDTVCLPKAAQAGSCRIEVKG